MYTFFIPICHDWLDLTNDSDLLSTSSAMMALVLQIVVHPSETSE